MAPSFRLPRRRVPVAPAGSEGCAASETAAGPWRRAVPASCDRLCDALAIHQLSANVGRPKSPDAYRRNGRHVMAMTPQGRVLTRVESSISII